MDLSLTGGILQSPENPPWLRPCWNLGFIWLAGIIFKGCTISRMGSHFQFHEFKFHIWLLWTISFKIVFLKYKSLKKITLHISGGCFVPFLPAQRYPALYQHSSCSPHFSRQAPPTPAQIGKIGVCVCVCWGGGGQKY